MSETLVPRMTYDLAEIEHPEIGEVVVLRRRQRPESIVREVWEVFAWDGTMWVTWRPHPRKGAIEV
jgi:hypothetical protein